MNKKHQNTENKQLSQTPVTSSPSIHELKTINPYFDDVFFNRKSFEVRKNDRDFKVGDRLKLVEHDPKVTRPRYVLKDIQYILSGGQYGIDPNYVVLGLKDIYPHHAQLSEPMIKGMEHLKSVIGESKINNATAFSRGCL